MAHKINLSGGKIYDQKSPTHLAHRLPVAFTLSLSVFCTLANCDLGLMQAKWLIAGGPRLILTAAEREQIKDKTAYSRAQVLKKQKRKEKSSTSILYSIE